MPILIDRKTNVLVHGVEGDVISTVHQLLAYGTKIVACIDSGKESSSVLDLPYFACVGRAKKQSGANTSFIFSPPDRAADAILEAEDVGISLIVCHTAAIPLQDMVEVDRIIRRKGRSRLIGPGSYGIITPDQSKIGCMPGYMYTSGSVGIISRYGTLMDDLAWHLSSSGIGQSTCVHTGDYPFLGSSVGELVALFEKDDSTETIIVIGEPEDFASLDHGRKKIVGFLPSGGTINNSRISVFTDIKSITEFLGGVRDRSN